MCEKTEPEIPGHEGGEAAADEGAVRAALDAWHERGGPYIALTNVNECFSSPVTTDYCPFCQKATIFRLTMYMKDMNTFTCSSCGARRNTMYIEHKPKEEPDGSEKT